MLLLHFGCAGKTCLMVEVTIKLPDALARSLGETPDVRARRVLENAAIEEYRTGRLSQRQVGEVLSLDYWQTERFLTEHKVPLNYSLADLEADRATLHHSRCCRPCGRLPTVVPAALDRSTGRVHQASPCALPARVGRTVGTHVQLRGRLDTTQHSLPNPLHCNR